MKYLNDIIVPWRAWFIKMAIPVYSAGIATVINGRVPFIARMDVYIL